MHRFILRNVARLIFALSLIILLLAGALLVFSSLVREDKGEQLKQLINQNLSGISVHYEKAAINFSFYGAHFNAAVVTVTAGNQTISAASADIWWHPQRLRIILDDAEFHLDKNTAPAPALPVAINVSVHLSAPAARISFADIPLTLNNADTNLAVAASGWTININEKQLPYRLDLRASGDLDNSTVQLYTRVHNFPAAWLPASLTGSALHATLAAKITDKVIYRAQGTADNFIIAAPSVTLHNASWKTSGQCRQIDTCLGDMQNRFTVNTRMALPYNSAVTVTLSVSGSGSKNAAHWNMTLSDIQLANHDGVISASAGINAAASLTLVTAAGSLSSIALTAVAPYAPAGKFKDWLNNSLLGGTFTEATFTLHTDAALQPVHTTVLLTAAFTDGTLVIDYTWPLATALDGTLYMRNDDIFIAGSGNYGTLFAPLVIADIPATTAEQTTLHLTVLAAPAALTAYFDEARHTPPLQGYMREADAEFRATGGRGQLSLAVTVPLAQPDTSRGEARLSVQHGIIQVPALPRYQNVQGNVFINNDNLRGSLGGRFAGMPLTAKPLEVVFEDTSFRLSGDIGIPLLLSVAGAADAPLSGTTPFLFTRNPTLTVFSAPLSGTVIDLPYPLGKTAETVTPLTVTLAATIAARYHNPHLTLQALITPEGSDIGINTPAAPPPARGVNLRGSLHNLNADDWLNQSAGDGFYFATLQLTLAQVKLMKMHNDSVVISGGGGGENTPLSLHLDASNMAGNVTIDDNAVYGDFSYLKLTLGADNDTQNNSSINVLSLTLALAAATVEINQLTLGQLTLAAAPRQDSWNIDTLKFISPKVTLDMQGHFQEQHTSLTILLEANELPALMTMLAIPPVFGHGAISLFGDIQWNGAPTDFNSDQLTGNLHLLGADIRYLDVNLTTDLVNFFAIFSPASIFALGFTDLAGGGGIVFQTVEGNIALKDGDVLLMPINLISRNLLMNIEGKTNYLTQRHNLYGRVRPGEKLLNASSAVGIGAGLVALSPASLVAGLFLGKLFEKPISEIGAYNYTITGSWDEPVYTEVTAGAAEQ